MLQLDTSMRAGRRAFSVVAMFVVSVSAGNARAGEGLGACCFGPGKGCVVTDEAACIEMPGEFRGDGTECSVCLSAMPTSFTYQGQLKLAGTPVNGSVSLLFSAWAQANDGDQVGGPLVYDGVEVVNGLFTVEVDFGPATFNGNARWIEVAVCESPIAGDRVCTSLSPRQKVTPTPYALQTRGLHVDEFFNVGVGTKQPSDKLSVAGGVAVDEFASNAGDLGSGALKFGGGGTGAGIASNRQTGDNPLGLDLFTNSLPRLSVTQEGRVGIGVRAPDDELSVAGSIGLDAFDDNIGDLSTGALKFGFRSGEAIASNRDGLGVNGFGLDFYTLFQKRMSISNEGDVGIGTATPTARLNVVGESDDFEGVVQAVQTGGSTFGSAIYAFTELTDGTGLISEANGFGAYAIWGRTDAGFAGVFDGDVDIAGTLSKSAGSFKIDHPLDPENKYLSHSFVESPDMMNVYNGNAVLGEGGTAWVELPSYFEALNSDFRYQLTAIGSASPNLHIAQEVRGNRFQIAGGAPGKKVSWQVTGIRQDAYARQNRIPVEENKPEAEKGRYRVPAAYGKTSEFSVHRSRGGTASKSGGWRENGASHAPRK